MAKAKSKGLKAGKRAIESVFDELKEGKVEKKQRTLFLNDENFVKFQKICERKGHRPAHLIDLWIKKLLEEEGKI